MPFFKFNNYFFQDGDDSIEERQIDNVPDVDNEKSESEKESSAPTPAKVPVYRLKLPAVMGPQPSIFKYDFSKLFLFVIIFPQDRYGSHRT